ncbi:translation initiation factor eIF2B subunit [Scheffersomyces coipomensis]|uniref:translation initiation factor eIF2B subunit n=1 Tax=Scheffersomyces coipomensis TaxID=1788519 RepID=UPI00315D2D06
MEFHAIIVCGKGKALAPFSQTRSTGVAKPLLPIANKPMINYVLEWCEKAFFPKVTIVTDSASKEEIERAVLKFKADYKIHTKSEEEGNEADYNLEHSSVINVLDLDTDNSGEILLHLYKSSQNDNSKNFVILPCDFVTNLPPQVLIEAYRNREDTDVGLLVTYYNQFEIEDKKFKIFPKNYSIYTELSDGKHQLLDMYSSEDIDFHKALQIRTQMCWRHGNSTISTKMLNSSIFFGAKQDIFNIFSQHSDKFTDSYFKNRSITKIIRDLGRRSWRHSSTKETIAFLTLPSQATFFRSNNLPVLMEANRYFMKAQAISKARSQGQPQKDKLAANIGIDSLVGESTTLGEKTNVKRSVVGSNCIIGKRVKLTGSLILDNVTIEDDVQLENCIIGKNAIIHNKSRLTNCNVESTNEVAKGTQAKGETLLCLSLEGIVEQGDDTSEYEDDSESDDDGSDDDEDEYDENEDEYAGNEDGLFAY